MAKRILRPLCRASIQGTPSYQGRPKQGSLGSSASSALSRICEEEIMNGKVVKPWPTLVWGDSHSPRCRRTWRGWVGSAGRPSGSSEQRSGNQPSKARPPENTNPDDGCPWLAYLQVGRILPLGSWIDPADLFAVVIHKLRPFVTILQDLLGLWLSKGRHVVVPDANIRRKLSCTQSNLLGSFIVKSMEVNGVNVIHKIWQFLRHLLKIDFSLLACNT